MRRGDLEFRYVLERERINMDGYILLADCEGEDTSRVCGRTSNIAVATAWQMGDGHTVYAVPLDGKLCAEGYEALDMTEVAAPTQQETREQG